MALWGRSHREPLLLGSSLSVSWELIELYKKRAAIEALFREWKSSGWQWEASQVREKEHQERLVLGLAFATLLTLLLGTAAAEQERKERPRGSLRRAWAGGHSLFRLGRDAMWQRLWQNGREVLRWELADLDGPRWSAESRAYHAPAGTTIGRRRS